MLRKWISNNALKKISIAAYRMTKESWEKNALGSPKLVKTTIVPVKAKPAKRPQMV